MFSILLVDDDDMFREMAYEVLKRAGYKVEQARDGNEALRIYYQQPTDLIITDLIMPNKEGLEIIAEFRRGYPDVKIIAMSGGGRINARNYLMMAEKFGARWILTKPFAHRDLLETVEEALNAQ